MRAGQWCWGRVAALGCAILLGACGDGEGGASGDAAGNTPGASQVTSAYAGSTAYGNWQSQITVDQAAWQPGQTLTVSAQLSLDAALLPAIAATGNTPDKVVMLLTAERMFDGDGWLRLSSDERMSTVLTPAGLAIEGGVQGAVTNRFGYPFKTPVDELIEQAVPSDGAASTQTLRFSAMPQLPADLPPGLYRLRADFGIKTAKGRYLDLNGHSLGSRPFMPIVGSYIYSGLVPASGTHVSGRSVDAKTLQARMPWTLLHNYNSNGYQGVVADEDQGRFALSQGSLIHDEVVLPLFDSNGNRIAYNLEPSFPADMIDARANLPWDWKRGELSLEITAPDGTRTTQAATPIVEKSGSYFIGPTTKNPAFTAWKPPMYGRYTVKLSGWIADAAGRRYEGGGTYRFWIAKRMTMATATFPGMAYPVGYKYGRDIAFSPPLPADVEITATLYPNSDPAQARELKSTGKASAGGVFGVAQGMQQLTLDAAGEYHGKILARYTDSAGDLWVCVMRHAGVVYPADSPIVARGKKLYVNKTYVERGDTLREGYVGADGKSHLEHIGFPYNPGDLLLMASDNQGTNKIEPVLIYENKGETKAWDTKLNGIGTTNLFIRTSNGLSPHLFPEYITDREYYYGAAPRPGFMSRFIVADSNTRAPYWATSPNSFGGQHGASANGDQPGDLYRFIGGVVKKDVGQAPAYAGYVASGAILPKGSNNNRVVAAGSTDIIGAKGEKARFFLVGFRPGMALEQGATWRPAVQVDPLLPANITLTLTYPDGTTIKTASGVADAGGSWAGAEAYPLSQAGIYRYQLSATWTDANGQTFSGKMPGLPDSGGEFYVLSMPRPSAPSGLVVDLPRQSVFSLSSTLKVSGRSTASSVHYALIMPGAVIAQGEAAVVNGAYQIDIDPGELNRSTPIYDIINYVSGKPQAGKILHLSLFAKEKAADGSEYWDFRRVIARGTTVISAK